MFHDHGHVAHGFGSLTWDDAALPQWWWDAITKTDRGCWVLREPKRSLNPREFIVTRLLRCEWRDVLAAIPTCANVGCVNPAHLCVTRRTKEEPT